MAIESQLKQRLVGIAVIVSLAVIFLPMLLDGAGMIDKSEFQQVPFEVPPPPKVERRVVDLDLKAKQLQQRLDSIPVLTNDIVDKGNKEKQKVVVAASKSVTQKIEPNEKMGGDSWIAQLGSFKDQDKAFKLQDKVRTYNIAAVFIQKVVIKNVNSFRVRLGPFLDQKQAKAAAEKLNKKHEIKAVIMKYDQ